MKRTEWLQHRYFEFRIGHSNYANFALAMINFSVISYSLLITKIPLLNDVFPHFITFAITFAPLYIIGTTMIGHYIYKRSQYKIEQGIATEVNPYNSRLIPGKEQLTTASEILTLRMLLRAFPNDEQIQKDATELIAKLESLLKGEEFNGFDIVQE